MYKFDPKNDPNIRYHDYTWNHFTIREDIPVGGDASWVILDPALTKEERLEKQKQINEYIKRVMPEPPEELINQVTLEERYIPGLHEEDPDVRIVICTPKDVSRGKRPAFLHLFGGGMVCGSPESQLAEMIGYALDSRAIGIAVAYRLLPTWSYPAAVDDAEAAVNYILEHAGELKINIKRFVVEGISAGGYLAACITQRLKMRGGFQFAGAMLIQPVFDDYFNYPSSNLYQEGGWCAHFDQAVFQELLGTEYDRASAPADAIPSHCKDFTGLPPTYIFSGDLDYGHDPIIKYAQGLMDADIFCDLHVHGGFAHGYAYVFGPTAGDNPNSIATRALNEYKQAMKDLLTGKCVHDKVETE